MQECVWMDKNELQVDDEAINRFVWTNGCTVGQPTEGICISISSYSISMLRCPRVVLNLGQENLQVE